MERLTKRDCGIVTYKNFRPADNSPSGWANGAIDRLAELEDKLESGELVKVVHGYWNKYECSICGATAEYGSELYCQNCGAKMDGKPKE